MKNNKMTLTAILLAIMVGIMACALHSYSIRMHQGCDQIPKEPSYYLMKYGED